MSADYELATFDIETDPFKYNREPMPFVVGFYSASTGFINWWGDNCMRDFVNWLYMQPNKFKVYAHNGGRFDFHYLLKLQVIENPIKIINRKIAKFKIGRHEFRDSLRILPIRLADYQKDEIDYKKLEKVRRNKYKQEIISYLKTDCSALFDLVEKFRDRFGDKLTIGGTSMAIMKEIYDLKFPFGETAQKHDEQFRQFYFGGRTQAFKPGIHKGRFFIYDINSSYPDTMANRLHPVGTRYIECDSLSELKNFRDDWPFFIELDCMSHGAFPWRDEKKGTLHFPHAERRYKVTSHEFNAALELRLLSRINVHKILIPFEAMNFKDFVNRYIDEKIAAKIAGNKADEIFAKILLNSGYGKLATNPLGYEDYYIRNPGDPRPDSSKGWTLAEFDGEFEIWARPSANKTFYDVAAGASITGGARATLLVGLAKNKSVYYCDTDSIITDREFVGRIHKTDLGAWDFEAEGDLLAIAGKKLYALMNKKEGVKKAHKGSKLDYQDILDIAKGKVHNWENIVPSFDLLGGYNFINRDIKNTAVPCFSPGILLD